jgi:hypothetical protein
MYFTYQMLLHQIAMEPTMVLTQLDYALQVLKCRYLTDWALWFLKHVT